ncbi:class I SAM-dependent methyltransferase [Embleya sp. NBC_00896]|uniref:class I SAM-dependent methyltransferase n=1 Tax=Embleya sp. NBC_00896 TaxID=2975961 RepID=UPI00386FD181|nr:cyclopropane-fatty-acyl-phospholipid synthase family protein [Embleya sp. NBC_00896]
MSVIEVAPARIDPVRWPDVAAVPRRPMRAAVARFLFERAVARLPLRVWIDGAVFGAGGSAAPRMRIVRPDAFFHRVGAGGLIGFGEAYQAGDWEADDLTALLTVFASRVSTLIPPALQRLRPIVVPRMPRSQRNTVAGARRNIHRHYDLSNELFATFLDETMAYSSAVFEPGSDGGPAAGEDALTAAQHRKIDRLLDLAAVGPGTRVLEIGTGWGELALRAAERGAHVHTITISAEQRDLAIARIARAGHADRVEVELCDYPQVHGSYDAIVSVEMIEAVGEEYWPIYFGVLDRRLAPGGRVALQSITMPHDRMVASRSTYTWIHKYIFPGGLIPSDDAVRKATSATRLRVADSRSYGLHYAETLRLWRERFNRRADEVESLGFDRVFRRMWNLYLAWSEAGFRSGYLDVRQYLLMEA